jgi:hypothetical protein
MAVLHGRSISREDARLYPHSQFTLTGALRLVLSGSCFPALGPIGGLAMGTGETVGA